MKKIFFTLAFASQIALSAFATGLTDKGEVYTSINKKKVNLYSQPAIRAEVAQVLSPTDKLQVLRKFDKDWTIVSVNGRVGYVSTVNLKKFKMAVVAEE